MDEDGRSEVTPEEQQVGAVCWRSTSSWLPEDARFGVPQRFHCAGEFPWCISMTHWRCQLIHLCDTTLLFLAVLREHPLFSPPEWNNSDSSPCKPDEKGNRDPGMPVFPHAAPRAALCTLFSQDLAVTLLLADTHSLLGRTSMPVFQVGKERALGAGSGSAQ